VNQDLSSTPEQYDVVVVGAGAAGLYAALCLPSHFRVALITKDKIDRSASDWAQGGIAAAIAPDDSPSLHIEDTLTAGAGLCDIDAVHYLANHASDCIESLVSLGVAFDRKDGELALTLEAAHSRRRVLHAADTTGRAIVSTLIQQVLRRSNVTIFDDAFVFDLWMAADRATCQGVCLLYENQIAWIAAQAIVLATGGGGQVFSQTTNPKVSTGDGVAIAWRAGAILRDLEFVQFHPTALTLPGAPRFLISEAVRGEGAHLVDRQGRRFAFDYHPKGELAPRDVVSRAIFDYLQSHSGQDGVVGNAAGLAHVWLDLRPIDPAIARHRFPNIIQICSKWGIDVFSTPIPVAPAAHYWMGGIAVDLQSQSTITGLYAVGETASTGVHGANRLASNSLLECLVFGAQLRTLELSGQAFSDKENTSRPYEPTSNSNLSLETGDIEQFTHRQLLDERFDEAGGSLKNQQDVLEQIQTSLPSLMWANAGISRNEEDMAEAIAQVELWEEHLAHLPITYAMSALQRSAQPKRPISIETKSLVPFLHRWGEARNLLTIARLILRSARFRRESRGGHYRSDFPKTESTWSHHTLLKENETWLSP